MTTMFQHYEGHGTYPHRATSGPFPAHDNYSYDSGNYWCDTCDKGFHSAHQLEKHKGVHQKCNIDGCQFIAHPNIITRHIQMQHATGLYKKIAKLNDPEEIKKWREERKKKYPTKQNIEKKAAQIKEKVARGEKMGILDSRKNRRSHKPDYLQTRKHGSQHKNSTHIRSFENKSRNENKSKSKPSNKVEKISNIALPTAEESRVLKPFGGIQELMYNSDDENNKEEVKGDDYIEEDEYVSETPPIDNKPLDTSETKVCGALNSLICNYGSSDEEGTDTEQSEAIISNNVKKVESKSAVKDVNIKKDDVVISNESTNIEKAQVNSIEIDKTEEMGDDSGPEETKIEKKENEEPKYSAKEKNCSMSRKDKMKPSVYMKSKPNNHNSTYRRKLPSTLLEKLLHKEIQKERNIVLQCIRHIVQNNYFQ